jgi:protein-S-isoprenylcysteine O-methyltransferase Ste14
MKLSRLRKVTWRLIVVYAAAIVVIAFADRSPEKWKRWNFWAGAAPIVVALWLRMWACGHLVKNKVLTVTGPYAYVKNPLYIGSFLMMIGFGLVALGDPTQDWYIRHFNWFVIGLGLVVFVGYYVPHKKRREGGRLRENFGEAWDHYDRAVPDYFPKLARYERAGDRRWSWKAACDNSEPWIPILAAAGLAATIWNGWILDRLSKLAP